jgi:hypothetical protein
MGLLLAAAVAALAEPRLRAQIQEDELKPSIPAVRNEVVDLISAQLAAFRARQWDRAYGFAAPALRVQLPEAQFMQIVRAKYPEIWANRRAEFEIVRDNGVRATVAVRVYDRDGSAIYDYILLRDGAGWTIGGVLRHVSKPDESL